VGGTDWAPWIDLFAPGTDIVSAYLGAASDEQVVVPRRDQPSDEVRIFSGWAKWSGTSFAAARVTGAIATQIAFRTGADEVLPAVRTLFPSPAIA
jgi:subtilisin family serine protease